MRLCCSTQYLRPGGGIFTSPAFDVTAFACLLLKFENPLWRLVLLLVSNFLTKHSTSISYCSFYGTSCALKLADTCKQLEQVANLQNEVKMYGAYSLPEAWNLRQARFRRSSDICFADCVLLAFVSLIVVLPHDHMQCHAPTWPAYSLSRFPLH